MKKLLLLTFLFISFLCEAQQYLPILEYQKCYGGSAEDRLYTSTKTHDNGLIIGATSESTDGDVTCNASFKCWISKLNDSLKTVWQVCIGGSFFDASRDIIETSDLGYLVCGDSESDDVPGHHINSNGSNSDVWVVKLNSEGNVQWQRSIGGTNDDRCFSAIEIKNEGYLILCNTRSSDGDLLSSHTNEDVWLIKLDYNGNIIWQKT